MHGGAREIPLAESAWGGHSSTGEKARVRVLPQPET
jgi:hypothetical protein